MEKQVNTYTNKQKLSFIQEIELIKELKLEKTNQKIDYTSFSVFAQSYFIALHKLLGNSKRTYCIKPIVLENREDVTQQCELMLLNAYSLLGKDIKERKFEVAIDKKVIRGTNVTDIEMTIEKVKLLYCKDNLPIISRKDLFTAIYGYVFNKVKYKFVNWCIDNYGSTINNTTSIDEEYFMLNNSVIGSHHGGEYQRKTILDSIEDTSSRLKMNNVEFINSIRGNLTKKQFNIIEKLMEGAKLIDFKLGGTDIKSLKNKLSKIGITSNGLVEEIANTVNRVVTGEAIFENSRLYHMMYSDIDSTVNYDMVHFERSTLKYDYSNQALNDWLESVLPNQDNISIVLEKKDHSHITDLCTGVDWGKY